MAQASHLSNFDRALRPPHTVAHALLRVVKYPGQTAALTQRDVRRESLARRSDRATVFVNMNSQKSIAPTLVLPGQGRVLRAFGDEVITHLEAKDTGGAFSLWTNITPPDGGPPPHYHLKEDECFVVQAGRISFLAEGKWQEVPVGGVVYAPRKSVHTFKNIGDHPSRLLISTSPGGFEIFFSRCADEFAKGGTPDMKRIVEISAEHGIHFVQG
jgi:mannose-6-phosphate isomerase-like protein (cupin superfamily)